MAGGLGGRGHEKTERFGDRKRGADDELRHFIGLAVMFAVPAIKDRDEREEGDADDGVESDEPGGWQCLAPEYEIELLVPPDEVGIEDLVVRHDRDGEDWDEEDERDDGAPVAAG